VKSSRRDLSNDMAEHRPILKNNQNTYYPRFSFTPKTGIAFPKKGVSFLLWWYSSYTTVSLKKNSTLTLLTELPNTIQMSVALVMWIGLGLDSDFVQVLWVEWEFHIIWLPAGATHHASLNSDIPQTSHLWLKITVDANSLYTNHSIVLTTLRCVKQSTHTI